MDERQKRRAHAQVKEDEFRQCENVKDDQREMLNKYFFIKDKISVYRKETSMFPSLH